MNYINVDMDQIDLFVKEGDVVYRPSFSFWDGRKSGCGFSVSEDVIKGLPQRLRAMADLIEEKAFIRREDAGIALERMKARIKEGEKLKC